jgi:hypothetical protein
MRRFSARTTCAKSTRIATPKQIVLVRLRKTAQCLLLSTAAASALLLAPIDSAEAISGGKESLGIFKPLDDEDLSGMSFLAVPFARPSQSGPQVVPALANRDWPLRFRIYTNNWDRCLIGGPGTSYSSSLTFRRRIRRTASPAKGAEVSPRLRRGLGGVRTRTGTSTT